MLTKELKMIKVILFYYLAAIEVSFSYKILGVFPYNGKSHHIMFSTFMEELAQRKHDVTVINYFPIKEMDNLKQISLKDLSDVEDSVDLQLMYEGFPTYFWEFFFAKSTVESFAEIANINCQKMIKHPQILEMIRSSTFDLIIVEQFTSDCALGLVNHIKSPSIGISAHVLMPWAYARFGIPNNPSIIPNHFIGTGSQPSLWGRIKSLTINEYTKYYYKYVIQKRDLELIRKILPNTPDLEIIARNLTLILVNQYFPFTGSRQLPANVIEIGGMHIKQKNIQDKELLGFLEEANHGVVYISLGTVTKTSSLTSDKVAELISLIRNSRYRFLWKREASNITDLPDLLPNLMIRDWFQQVDILCHPKVVAFISHSGMLGSAEAMHCGVPVVNVPLFGDQFANAASARESGVGVTVSYHDFDEPHLTAALNSILQPGHVSRVKRLSSMWRNRLASPMDTAVFWVEFAAEYGGAAELRTPTVDIPLHQYLMLDILVIAMLTLFILCGIVVLSFMLLRICLRNLRKNKSEIRHKRKIL